ncbi:MAG: Helix-turn-helix domain protein [Spirochaetes bacterium ADurb.Bin133]|jgi:y4mF family transcriptional regulator|nr:MAG: Helix-turn-helix domain protein [Spirochaetes bacterium ADurb.Bin133]
MICMNRNIFSDFFKEQRKKLNLTQEELSLKSGVGLRFIRDVEQGKETIRLDKLNQVMLIFNSQAGPVSLKKTDSNKG